VLDGKAAWRQGVKRFIFASSNHTLGYYETSDTPIDEYLTPLPDTYYGVGKAMGEALGAYYHHRFGMDVICVRIGSQFPEPLDVRMLSTWLSPDDAGRLFEACLTAPDPGFRIVWGMSANTRGGFSREEGRRLGYEPRDDAETYATALIEKSGDLPADSPLLRYVGGASAIKAK
jgi:uronate dehydrogenase